MEYYPLRFQAGIFTNNEDITTEPKIIQKLFSELIQFDLMPGTIGEIDPIKGALSSRLKFVSTDNVWQIVFGLNKIDIECNIHELQVQDEATYFIDRVINIIEAINKIFPRIGNRLSFITTYTNDTATTDQKNEFYTRNFNNLNINQGQTPVEWSFRNVFRDIKVINDKEELMNNIVLISRVNLHEVRLGNNLKEIDRMDILVDVNTYQLNNSMRFSLEDFKVFFSQAKFWNISLFDKIKSLLK